MKMHWIDNKPLKDIFEGHLFEIFDRVTWGGKRIFLFLTIPSFFKNTLNQITIFLFALRGLS